MAKALTLANRGPSLADPTPVLHAVPMPASVMPVSIHKLGSASGPLPATQPHPIHLLKTNEMPLQQGPVGQTAGRELLSKLQLGQGADASKAASATVGSVLLEQLTCRSSTQAVVEPSFASKPQGPILQPLPAVADTNFLPALAQYQYDGQALGRNLLAGLRAQSPAGHPQPPPLQNLSASCHPQPTPLHILSAAAIPHPPPPVQPPLRPVGIPVPGLPVPAAGGPPSPLDSPPENLGTSLLLKLQRAGPFANPQAPSLVAGQQWGRHILSHLQGNHLLPAEAQALNEMSPKGWDEIEVLLRLQRAASGSAPLGATQPVIPPGHPGWAQQDLFLGLAAMGQHPGSKAMRSGDTATQSAAHPCMNADGSRTLPHNDTSFPTVDSLHCISATNGSIGASGVRAAPHASAPGLARKPSQQQLQRGRKLLEALTSGRSVGAMAATQLPARPPGLGPPSGESSPMAPAGVTLSSPTDGVKRASSLSGSLGVEGSRRRSNSIPAGVVAEDSKGCYAPAAQSPLGSGQGTPQCAATSAPLVPNQGTLSAVARALRDVQPATPPAADSPGRGSAFTAGSASLGTMTAEQAAAAQEAVKAALRPPTKAARKATMPPVRSTSLDRKPDTSLATEVWPALDSMQWLLVLILGIHWGLLGMHLMI